MLINDSAAIERLDWEKSGGLLPVIVQDAFDGRVLMQAFANRDADSNPSLPLDSYAGTYRDPWYGNVFVETGEDGLIMRFGRSDLLTGPLEHFQHDTFVARWLDRSLHADAYVTFILGADGEVESIRMKALSPDTDFSFDFHHLDLRRAVED